jgi:NADH:ubiquinone oxidoreductase subunit E
MSDHWAAELPGSTGEPLEFFGSEEAQPLDQIDPDIWESIDRRLAERSGGQERLIPLLHMVQEKLGYIPFAVQEYVAEKLGMSPIQVYGVVSFYHFFTTTPRGRHQFKVCMGTACFVRQAERLVSTISDAAGLKVGEVTDDRLFSLEHVRCLGACGLAPAIMLNNDTHGNLTPKDARKMVLRLKSKARREQANKAESQEDPSD